MRDIVKVKSAMLGKLNLAEYASLVEYVYRQVQALDTSGLGIEAEVMERYGALLADLRDMLGRCFALAETAELATVRVNRNRLMQYVLRSVRSAHRLGGLTSRGEPARVLYNVVKPCFRFYELPDMQIAAVADALLYDLAKPENVPHVEALGLTDVVAELQAVNLDYHRLVYRRMEARGDAHALGSSKALRSEMDRLYDYVVTIVFCHSVIHPTPELDDFVALLNRTIAQIKTSYRQRTAKRESGGPQ